MHETFREIQQEISVRRIDFNSKSRNTTFLFGDEADGIYSINSFVKAGDYWKYLNDMSSTAKLRIATKTENCIDLRKAHDIVEDGHFYLCELRKTHLPDNEELILSSIELGSMIRRRMDPEHSDAIRRKTLRFVDMQKMVVHSLEDYLQRKMGTLEKKERWSRSDDYLKWRKQHIAGQMEIFPNDKTPGPRLHWNRSDTDLLELATALHESNAVKSEDGRLTKKQLQNALEWIFNRPINDASVKLAKARNRKMASAPFMDELRNSFADYVIRRDQMM